mmetsp:Transcript_71618/g.119115  ORF Transcript_71618/g.119115 Transcript_71618/m.119115 type:complete len:107 (-) Transcript_71618:265-585(-)
MKAQVTGVVPFARWLPRRACGGAHCVAAALLVGGVDVERSRRSGAKRSGEPAMREDAKRGSASVTKEGRVSAEARSAPVLSEVSPPGSVAYVKHVTFLSHPGHLVT